MAPGAKRRRSGEAGWPERNPGLQSRELHFCFQGGRMGRRGPKGIQTILGGLELSLNEEKTKVLDARKERLDFLGFTLGVLWGWGHQ